MSQAYFFSLGAFDHFGFLFSQFNFGINYPNLDILFIFGFTYKEK
ncbi:hypothetical protein EV142_10998 [Flavobacterium circumlabens]|uniref:Uncharacterized protein n=1 Tax=Flavobacterium circumlabens TaxID=2133765 RepID=A0ABY2AW31_9FLAO|nr:hypothetical protein EV142_10998 [Flavobacterium circumlabens]